MKPQIVFLVGPTAIGKTGFAVRLAKKLNAEVISCDSMQIYKGMAIVASQPSTQEKRAVSHHLVGVISAEQEFNVSTYRRLALKAVGAIRAKGKLPLFVGGSGLYMSVVVDGIFKRKTENKRVRDKLYAEAQLYGSAQLHSRLAEVDAPAAARIHPNDTRRIVRALEVFMATGKPISELQATRKGLSEKYDIRIFGLDMARAALDARINKRVSAMFRQGAVKEVKGLLKKKLSKTARCAIGIAEINAYLEGRMTLAEAKGLMKKNTRRYARRQMTWFRKDKRIQWIKNEGQFIAKLRSPQQLAGESP